MSEYDGFNPLNRGGGIQAGSVDIKEIEMSKSFNPLNPFDLHSGTRRGGGIQA